MFHNDQKVFVCCTTYRQGVHVGKIIDMALSYFPEWFSPKVKNSQNEKKFITTNSVIWFGTLDSVKGKKLTHLVVDEAAFIPDMHFKWKCVYPAVDGQVFVLSTTNGVGNWFEETYRAAVDGKNNFVAFKTSYLDHPDWQDVEKVEQVRKNLGEAAFLQEMMCEFVVDTYQAEAIRLSELSDAALGDEIRTFASEFVKKDYGKFCLLMEASRRLSGEKKGLEGA